MEQLPYEDASFDGSPLEWGREEHSRELLGDDFELRFVHGNTPEIASSAEERWQLMVTSFGPVKTPYGALEEDRREQLHGDYIANMSRHQRDGRIEAPREYLLILGTRR